ncbi:MAG: lipoprotein signal peptidase [Flavobacteriaceae bacterium]|jgi:signal peptidase II|nr:lipoprotein signal peptidase [Flavobacteriaceae bacterium]
MNLKKVSLFVLLLLIVDQWSKIYVKTHFYLGESIEVFSWFKILFIENEGAAWGTKLSDILPIAESSAKLFLTLFRLVAITAIGYWVVHTVKNKGPKLLIIAQILIFAGALGNIIDSVFYGLIFNHSNGQIASWMAEVPYSKLFHGKVVDMLYFPLIDTTWPNWMPFIGGNQLQFFQPVFNIADTAISTGVGILLVFSKKVFPKSA